MPKTGKSLKLFPFLLQKLYLGYERRKNEN